MGDLQEILDRRKKIENTAIEDTRKTIDNSRFRKVEDLPNGDKRIYDLSAAYVVDPCGNLLRWEVRDDRTVGGWAEADFNYGDIHIGGPNHYHLRRKPFSRYLK